MYILCSFLYYHFLLWRRIKHGETEPQRFKCDDCDLTFTFRSNLNRHHRIQHVLQKVKLLKKIINFFLILLIYFRKEMIDIVEIIVQSNNWLFIEFQIFNIFCIPESFNTNNSHQLFDYIITFCEFTALELKLKK